MFNLVKKLGNLVYEKGTETRYQKLLSMSVDELAGTLSYYFGCDRCPAKTDICQENDSMCIDAIREWLKEEGEF